MDNSHVGVVVVRSRTMLAGVLILVLFCHLKVIMNSLECNPPWKLTKTGHLTCKSHESNMLVWSEIGW